MKERLLDRWSMSGSDLEQFKNVLEEITSSTSTKKVESRNVTLYSKDEHVTPSPERVPVYVLAPGNVWEVSKTGQLSLHSGALKRETFTAAGADDLLNEYETTSKLMLNIDGKVYFASKNLSPTLGLRTEMKGESVLEPSLARDCLTAERLNNSSEITFITRNVGGLRKVFAAMSGTYAYVGQNFLCKVINQIESEAKLGRISCKTWSVDNQISEIWLEFPDKAEEIAALYAYDDDIIPGLYLAKSDVGECSITIRATWRIKNSIIIADEIKRKHTGKIEIKDILKDADKIVFSKYTILPERLCELMATDITNPVWTKMPHKKFLAANEKAINEAIKSVFNQIGMVGAIGKKNEKSIYEQLCGEIDAANVYTAYDIVMMVMQLPERLMGLSSLSKEMLAKACGKAPYVDFDKPKASKVVLTA